MRDAPYRWRPSSMLLAASGILLIGVGIYFLVLRPPLLPEDIWYMSLTPAELQSIGPRLTSWLTHVFRVMGGYVAATGVLALTLALTSFRDHRALAAAGAALAGGLSIGLMAVVNFMIHSDFKWVLLGMALVWAASLAVFVRESAVAPSGAKP
ncbi:hypothetical protein [Bradyrhizobium liaoningense]|uniref:hypothetical protein n=1 Tax=Bradyrhizobium liaoningense TaxID=43992 RepID=UPI001BAB4E2C|nr:hypothetical protein [Bradyrhizobium liaoningense]MBR0714025.1 hypothetical protein [Bradyrhizobium liaoningense]